MPDLTLKQELFCQKYIETGTASEAYRQSYDTENMLAKTVWEEASRTLADPKVTARIKELQQIHQKRHEVTVDSLTEELDELKKLAAADKQYSPAVTAVMGKAKLHGKLPDKVEHTGKDGGPIVTEERSALEAARRIAFVLAKASLEPTQK